MTIRKVLKEVYITEDQSEFGTEEDAKDYEKALSIKHLLNTTLDADFAMCDAYKILEISAAFVAVLTS